METRQRLLACAFAELERSGVDRFSLRAVGVDAGLSPMAVYRHFDNKEALLRSLGMEAFDAWQKRVEAIKEKDFEKWYHNAMRAYAEFALDEPARFDACFVLNTKVERLYPQDFRAGKSPVVALTVARIQTAQRDGRIKRGDALEMALFAWAQLHGLVMLHRAGRFSLPRAAFLALCKRCSAYALRGLRA